MLLYGAYGVLDIVLLSSRVHADPATLVAAALMTVGLLAKTALFPLHLWLPPAHAGAPAPASAVLSALVVKGSFFIVVRLWFDVMPGLPGLPAAQLLAALGAAAIVVGNVVALRQERLKLLIAYSTLAQIGYLFLMFPLAFDPGVGTARARRRAGGRAPAGDLARDRQGRDVHGGGPGVRGARARSHRRTRRRRPGAAGDRPGLRPGRAGPGRRAAERRLPREGAAARRGGRDAASGGGRSCSQAGGFFTSGYLVLVLAHALRPAGGRCGCAPPSRASARWSALALALCSLSLGLVPWEAYLPVAPGAAPNPLAPAAFAKTLWPILGGAVLAILLGRWGDGLPPLPGLSWRRSRSARNAALAVGGLFERTDGLLRQWPTAGLSLLALAILFAAAMKAGR